VKSFLIRDGEALDAITADDRIVDGLEVELDDRVVELVATNQPVAFDLRLLLMVLKISNDIERIGDHAHNIAKAARRLSGHRPLPEVPEMAELGILSRKMLQDALAAFGSRDSGLAREVCARDDRVDDLKRVVYELLTELMMEDVRRIPPALEYIRVAQQLERIGDLSTNIAEHVVFLVEGRTIKHHAERESSDGLRD
jgi:phosphate transport system protein